MVTNRGPRQDGYTYCRDCGLIEPTATPEAASKVLADHDRPYPHGREQRCEQRHKPVTGIVLGTDFITDVMLISIKVDAPMTLRPALRATDVALRTLGEALVAAACHKLELEPGELEANYRPALTPRGPEGSEAELYLYDTLPGGAGFSRQVEQLGIGVFELALQMLTDCECDSSCYKCLRSYKNKFEHDLLDRHVAAYLLRYLLYGERQPFDQARLDQAADILLHNLQLHGVDGYDFERNCELFVDGIGEVKIPILAFSSRDGSRSCIGISGPLTPDHASESTLNELNEYGVEPQVILVDELLVRKNLPQAMSVVLRGLGVDT